MYLSCYLKPTFYLEPISNAIGFRKRQIDVSRAVFVSEKQEECLTSHNNAVKNH